MILLDLRIVIFFSLILIYFKTIFINCFAIIYIIIYNIIIISDTFNKINKKSNLK